MTQVLPLLTVYHHKTVEVEFIKLSAKISKCLSSVSYTICVITCKVNMNTCKRRQIHSIACMSEKTGNKNQYEKERGEEKKEQNIHMFDF